MNISSSPFKSYTGGDRQNKGKYGKTYCQQILSFVYCLTFWLMVFWQLSNVFFVWLNILLQLKSADQSFLLFLNKPATQVAGADPS